MSKEVQITEDWTNHDSIIISDEDKIMYQATRDYVGPLSPAEPAPFSQGITITAKDEKIISFVIYQTGINGYATGRDISDNDFQKNLSSVIDLYINHYSDKHKNELNFLLENTLSA